MNPQPSTSVYIHIPFCTHRCAYCDFNTYAGQETLIPAYVEALIRDIDFVSKQLSNFPTFNNPTVFFGGGTPSLLSGPQLASVMDALRAAFAFTPDLEATLEANPGTCSFNQLLDLRKAGINRLSFGVQSANREELRMLERAHDFFDVIQSVKWARQAGFENLNLDLIYGLPEQTLLTWQTTLKRALDLHPEHISAYALTLEHGTPFGKWSSRGLLPFPDPDLAAEMYEWAGDYLESNGYIQYEISNWALDRGPWTMDSEPRSTVYRPPSNACRHNLQYWRALPYLGLGAGAHGYANGYRYSNVLRIKTYIDRLAILDNRTSNLEYRISNLEYPLSPATVNQHKQSLRDDMSEFMLNGLRLTREGVSVETFRARFGSGLDEVYGQEVEALIRLGLLEWQAERLILTRRGRLLGNQVFMRFVGE